MKNQYFGDINDFRKYGLLRAFLSSPCSLGICWMCTPDDGGNDGKFLKYLRQPRHFRHFDPELYDWMANCVSIDCRSLAMIENNNILADTLFHSSILTDDIAQRQLYFKNMLDRFKSVHLIFFDPDNGIEVSVPAGKRKTCKYLYWSEIEQVWQRGHSVLIYQHFGRVQRTTCISNLMTTLHHQTGGTIVSFKTPHTLFLLAIQNNHLGFLQTGVERLSLNWSNRQIEIIKPGRVG